MESDRGHWYLITALVLGLGLGLVTAWVLFPTQLQDTHPEDLRPDHKDIYRGLIARAYQANENIARAEARLDLLGDENPPQALAAQAQRSLAERGDQEMAKILANLAAALQRTPQSQGTTPPSSPPAGTTATSTPSQEGTVTGTGAPNGTDTPQGPTNATETLQPTITPSATNAPPFIVQDHAPVCDPSLDTPLIQVYASNAGGEGIPGVEISITWPPDHQETFLTGLKPEIDPGYADFEVQPDVKYTIELPDSGLLLSDLQIQQCQSDSGESYPGSYQIYITHPN